VGSSRRVLPFSSKFVTQIAARFGLVVTQKVAAQALPVVGALGGAAVNSSTSRTWPVVILRSDGSSVFMARIRFALNTIRSLSSFE
jgi:hypothetical protein